MIILYGFGEGFGLPEISPFVTKTEVQLKMVGLPYRKVFALADRQQGKPLPRAVLPGITLKSPKITRNLTTAWFAQRVDERRQRCMNRAGAAPIQ